MKYAQVIHPIPVYKTSKHGITSSTIISKYKKKKNRWSGGGGRIVWRRWLGCGSLSALDQSLDLYCSSLLMRHSLLYWSSLLRWNSLLSWGNLLRWSCRLWWTRRIMLRWWLNTQMLSYLTKDGSMLGLHGNKLILTCTYDYHLLGENTLSSAQCL